MRYRVDERGTIYATGSSRSRAIDVSSKWEDLQSLPEARSSPPLHAASIVPTSSASNRKVVPFLLALSSRVIYRGSLQSHAGQDQRAARGHAIANSKPQRPAHPREFLFLVLILSPPTGSSRERDNAVGPLRCRSAAV